MGGNCFAGFLDAERIDGIITCTASFSLSLPVFLTWTERRDKAHQVLLWTLLLLAFVTSLLVSPHPRNESHLTCLAYFTTLLRRLTDKRNVVIP